MADAHYHDKDLTSLMYHHSRSRSYRWPFGAVATETYIDLGIDVKFDVSRVVLCYAYGRESFFYSERCMEAKKEAPTHYHARLRMPGQAGLFFYWFRIRPAAKAAQQFSEARMGQGHDDAFWREANPSYYYVCSRSSADGTGRFSQVPARIAPNEDRYPAAFQITVFEKDFKTPDWMKGAVMYQIFPDRFARDVDFTLDKMKSARPMPERIYHDDWYEDVDIHGAEHTGYIACDFFGGTLDGINEKVSYLEKLHVDGLYLNPVFEARSNHRYDTADYRSVDPMLGGNSALKRLIKRLKGAKISLLLDGVFSHTGADSLYFNKYRHYPGLGAYHAALEGKDSLYLSWYRFYLDDYKELAYDAWWDFSDLPNVNEHDLYYRAFILSKDGVLRNWLAAGASGFRLDVSDELPDDFLRELRDAVKAETDGQGLVLGEVWEDASNKISYGSYRDFLFGHTHDCVMGYPFRDYVLGYLTRALDAQMLDARLEGLRENYPKEAHYCNLNLISSHDVPRAITVLAGDPDPGDRPTQATIHMSDKQIKTGLPLIKLAYILQMTCVGAPCIYYGDEIGLEGYRDPFNRRTYPWDRLKPYQEDLLAFYQTYSFLRRDYPVLKTGHVETLYAQGSVYAFRRFLDEERKDAFGKRCSGAKSVVVVINRDPKMRSCFKLYYEASSFKLTPEPDREMTFDHVKLNRQKPLVFCVRPMDFSLFYEK